MIGKFSLILNLNKLYLKSNTYIYIFCVHVCLFVCIRQRNIIKELNFYAVMMRNYYLDTNNTETLYKKLKILTIDKLYNKL